MWDWRWRARGIRGLRMRKLGEEFGGERVGRNWEEYRDRDRDM